MKKIIVGLFLFACNIANAQIIKGIIKDEKKTPIIGALVQWQESSNKGVFSDENGNFTLSKSEKDQHLIVSFVGYKTDTIQIKSTDKNIEILLKEQQDLKEVTVHAKHHVIDELSPRQVEIITTKELAKAACCNLSESFDTNASVNVSYADAVTGAKQIEMLGLNGQYVQIQTENVPAIRGLATTFGLSQIPGTWLQSIDIGKGTGSVVNGFESISGAMNIEYFKPEIAERVYFNVFGNSFGRGEINLNLNKKINEKLATGIYSHFSGLNNAIDKNKDGFLDMPKYHQINLMNRWSYVSERWVTKFGIRVLNETKNGGNPNDYIYKNTTQQLDWFLKNAILFPKKPYMGLGLILSGMYHQDNSIIGQNNYDAKQNSFYANLIFQNIIGDTRHSYKLGASFQYDQINTQFSNINLPRTDVIPGAFLEYNYKFLEKTVLSLGGRVDYLEKIGTKFSPRIHIKQNLNDEIALRISAGKGFRMANPFAEYYSRLVSNRKVIVNQPYFEEEAWNYGASLNWTKQKLSWITDVYFTTFNEQLVADRETQGVLEFYTSKEKSQSLAFQSEFGYTLNEKLNFKLAYRYVENKQRYKNNAYLNMPFLPNNRLFFNMQYALKYNKWKFDATLNWTGKQRLPYLEGGKEFSNPFFGLNSQINRNFTYWEYYIGGENLTNYTQKSPIQFADQPQNPNFDASLIYGPIIGARFYFGIRYKLK